MALLRPVDVLVVAKIAATPVAASSYDLLADSLSIGKSTAHEAVRRAQDARLLSSSRTVNPRHVAELLTFGVRYLIPARLGAEMRGIPTSHGAAPLLRHFGLRDDAPVWPSVEGTARGPAVEPIFKTAPKASLQDSRLYEILSLIDALRVGRAREVALAKAELKTFFGINEW